MSTPTYSNCTSATAAEFLADFAADPSEVLLLEALVTAAEDEDQLEPDTAEQALAAAEVVAAWLGAPAPDFPTDLQEALADLDLGDEEELRELAQQAVAGVVAQAGLLDLPAATQPAWHALQQGLQQRLT